MPSSRRALLQAALIAGAGTPLGVASNARAATSARPAAAAAPASSGWSGCEPRYLGYREADQARPYASFFTGHTAAPQAQVASARAAAPLAADGIPPFSAITRDLGPTGYSRVETGYGQTRDGVVWVAVLTRMPRVTAAMWDWWFGWHSIESARYKLWHPDAHAFCALEEDRTTTPGLTDRERYVDNVSYVDEYVGDRMENLAIAFQDPMRHGFAVPSGHTVVFGRVGTSVAPVDLGWLAHQVRPVAGGAEMRSRFYLNVPGLHDFNAGQAVCAFSRGALDTLTQPLPLPLSFGRDLLLHCGQEMNHLARFLPELYARFAHR